MPDILYVRFHILRGKEKIKKKCAEIRLQILKEMDEFKQSKFKGNKELDNNK